MHMAPGIKQRTVQAFPPVAVLDLHGGGVKVPNLVRIRRIASPDVDETCVDVALRGIKAFSAVMPEKPSLLLVRPHLLQVIRVTSFQTRPRTICLGMSHLQALASLVA